MRVVIADDHYPVREGTRQLLESSGEVDVVAAVEDGEQLKIAVDRLLPDAVVVDIRMPPGHQMEGIEAAHSIRLDHPGVGIVVLSQHANSMYAFELFKDGTGGLAYLLKDRVGDLDELLRALREVTSGLMIDGSCGRQRAFNVDPEPPCDLLDREQKIELVRYWPDLCVHGLESFHLASIDPARTVKS